MSSSTERKARGRSSAIGLIARVSGPRRMRMVLRRGNAPAEPTAQVVSSTRSPGDSQQRWATRAELRLAIVTWIEKTYHRTRRQRRLGRLTPIEFETINRTAHAA